MSKDAKQCGCGPTCCSTRGGVSATDTVQAVREKYAETARSALSNASAGVQAVAEAFGYSAQELTSIPAEANMGLSCGNPVATAHLNPGEIVVDLGSGGGLDVFLSAQKVGPTGKAIGIDMTPDMVDRARRASLKGVDGKPISNVEFHQAMIDQLPIADESVDVIISNCVINLAPDKSAVFREMYRVLKPGGRVAVSDIVLKKPLPDDIRTDVMAYVGCIAGAVLVADYEAGLRNAGFRDIALVDARSDLNAYAQVEGQAACCSPTSAGQSGESGQSSCCAGSSGHARKATLHDHLSDLVQKYDINAYAASMKIFAIKPAGRV